MQLEIPSFPQQEIIPEEYAFGVKDQNEHIRLGQNRNPHIKWSQLPEATQSLVLICVDPDAPADPGDVNQEGKVITEDFPRTDFYHWVVANIDPNRGEIKPGEDSDGITPKGKATGKVPYGDIGCNDYSNWFAKDAEMSGKYGGYDGPCPPWNDMRMHHYYFRLYALDIARLELPENFTSADVLQAMHGHVLAEAEWMGKYSLNPDI